MNLGLQGKKAIVCASSRGLGRACAMALALEGVEIVVNGRDPERVETTASAIRNKTGTSVLALVADLCSEDGREKLVAACPEPDILVTNNGGPAPGRFEDWDHAAWLAALEQNLLAPALIIRAVIGGMRARRFGRIVNITSAMVKSPHPLMGLSTAARSALTAVCKGLSREVARDNVTINNLLPERIDTDRQRLMAGLQAAARGISMEQAYAEIAASIAANRLGTPEEFAAACVYLCSAQAGFVSGQNLQIDGGSYAGLI
ncbi:SDR family oxidoreductase [Candidatus Binatus sp.]|uniref:SDR family oxidoreductase n=1 Tax=Candidatus Binatus sp. TaxID=2811406 RepID=UPI003C5D4529